MTVDRVMLTCEHGGNRVPARYASCFRGAGRVLASHRGWDPGALGVARRLRRRLELPLHFADVTRLLVELNVSEWNRRLFSEFVDGLGTVEKERILERYYRPYRTGLVVGLALLRPTHLYWSGSYQMGDV